MGVRTSAAVSPRAVLGTLPCLFLLAGTAAGGQNGVPASTSPPVAEAVDARERTAIDVDGLLDEPAWELAQPITNFVQRLPDEGGAPSFRTEARVAFDADAIYVGVRAHDAEPDRIAGFLTRRDLDSPSDWLRVLIDSYDDDRTGYQFSVNPVGVKQDAYWYNDGSQDVSWDAVWDVAVVRDSDGWCAEFRIPFSQLRFDDASTGTLGFAVLRDVARIDEIITWPLIARTVNGYVSQFGELRGVTVSGTPSRLELVPYTVAQVRTEPRESANPLQETIDPGAAVGLDLKYAVTPALNLTATLNPDFGQVESDPATVNLSAFETFFREQRPFFVEGSGTYRFDIDCSDDQCTGLFYSRRIGQTPRGRPDLPDDGFSVQPLLSTILWAGKLTGRVGAFSVGVLTAATQEERARIAAGGTRRTEVVEPRTFYSVARARREFADQSSLGFMVTSTNRDISDAVSFLPNRAVTGGVDYDWRLGEQWSLYGFWAGSAVDGSTEAITRLQRSSVHSFQRPRRRPCVARPWRHRATRARGQGGHSKDLGRARPDGRGRVLQVSGFRRQRSRVSASRRQPQPVRVVAGALTHTRALRQDVQR